MRHSKLITAACLASIILPCNGNLLLFKDTFNTGDGQLSGSDTTGRLGGTAGGETSLESFGAHQYVTNNELDLLNIGGTRFGGENARYDWAGATTGADILAAGGFTVTFDWTFGVVGNEWIAWKVGTENRDTNVNEGSVDHALLLRQNGLNERWDNGTNLGDSGISFAPAGGVPTTYPVVLSERSGEASSGRRVEPRADHG